MKKILTALAFLALSSTLFAETAAEKAKTYYQAGVAAEKAGNPAAAREAYQKALVADPRNADAQYRLGELKLHSARVAATGRESKFSTVVIPAFQTDGATVQESIDLLSTSASKASNGEVAPNFIIEDPKGLFASKKLSIQLKNIPAKAVLDYILAQAGGKARYDEHAIVIQPR